MKILLGDVSTKVGREDIFKPVIGNESLHEASNDNGVRVVNFANSKNLIVKSTTFPHREIHKYTWTSDSATHNHIDHVLIEKRRHSRRRRKLRKYKLRSTLRWINMKDSTYNYFFTQFLLVFWFLCFEYNIITVK
jgi:hypothetical protein